MKKRRFKKMSKSRKERLKQIGKWVGLSALTYESFMLFVRARQRKRDVFNLALQRQVATKKPLLVIGDPGGDVVSRVFGNDFDCADLCISPKGCPSCSNVIAKPVDEALASLGDGSYIVFVAPGILERVPSIQTTLESLQRVSGGDVFIAHTHPWTLLSLFAKRRIKSAPPTGDFTEWRDLPWLPGPSKVEQFNMRGLGALDTKSLWPMVAALGGAGAYVGFKMGDDRALPALAGGAAGTAAAAMIVKYKRDAAMGA